MDTRDKLQKQLDDYRKAFTRIFLVTHHTLAKSYLYALQGTPVGLLSLSGRFNLTCVKEAEDDYTGLDNNIMMRCLKKSEYSDVIRQINGVLPNVSNIKFFAECLSIAKTVDPKLLHDLALKQLRGRIPAETSNLESDTLPKEIKHICLCIDPNQQEYENLFSFLNLNL